MAPKRRLLFGMGPRKRGSAYRCPECDRSFITRRELVLHSEDCVTEAFEAEVLSTQAEYYQNSIKIVPGEDPIDAANKKKLRSEVEEATASIAVDESDLGGFGDDQDELLLEMPSEPFEVIWPTDGNRKPRVVCPVCLRPLFRHNFAVHYRIHTGEQPYPCALCEKRFRTKSQWNQHYREHIGAPTYACPDCEYATCCKRNILRHVERSHPEQARPVASDAPQLLAVGAEPSQNQTDMEDLDETEDPQDETTNRDNV